MTATPVTHDPADVHHDDHDHPPPSHSSSRHPWGIIGIYTFIISEIALFGSFFMAYFIIRVIGAVDYAEWQEAFAQAIPLEIALINTAILLSSSIWIWFAERGFKQGNKRALVFWLSMTILFGSVFLGIQIYEYAELVTHKDIGPSSNAFSSVFFMITGLHGSHVLVGLILLGMLLVRAVKGRYELGTHPPQGFMASVIYWHFVDVVWIVVLTTLYLL